jgi:iron(II)-dependent oxidoreductase
VTAAAKAPVTETTRETLAAWVRDARERTLRLATDLSDEQWLGPRLSIVNPLRWELGHVAWFQERWVLRHAAGRPPLSADGDALYDSATVPHDVRWDLPLPDREGTLGLLRRVRDLVLERIADPAFSERDAYFVRLAVFHEDMHDEAFAYTRQTLGYPWIEPVASAPKAPTAAPAGGDARIPGGTFRLGASRDEPFVFDNEKWEHSVEVAPFAIARTAVTQEEFARFVDAGGYARREHWTDAGWAWRETERAEHPVHWRRDAAGWSRRVFDRWVPLEPRLPVIHVNAHEAEAYARFAGRRLPTEVEWEVAAAGEPEGGGLSARKRRRPWGDAEATTDRANLAARAGGCVDVDACAAGDSAFGVRQAWGNVWEWTSTPFLPYPGFVVDPYREYSEPWFGNHRVLRGGCWVTQPRLLRSTWRNFYTPDRRDVWAGFRTCALE